MSDDTTPRPEDFQNNNGSNGSDPTDTSSSESESNTDSGSESIPATDDKTPVPGHHWDEEKGWVPDPE